MRDRDASECASIALVPLSGPDRMAKARVASLAVAAAHATLVVVSTLGFFVFEPLVGVVATNGAWQDSALDIVLSVLHGLVCLVPVWLVALSRGGRLTRGLKQAITASCAVAVLVQALRLACLAYVAAAAATALGSWLATLIALALDVVVLLALLTLSMTSRLDSVRYAHGRGARPQWLNVRASQVVRSGPPSTPC